MPRLVCLALLGIAACTPPRQSSESASPATRSLPQGVIIVANQQSADATIIELPAGTRRQVPVGTGPHEALVGRGAGWGLVTVYGNREEVGSRLALLDPATGTLTRYVDLGTYTRPHGAVALPGTPRRVVVTSETTQNLVIVNLDEGRVESAIPTGAAGSHMVAVTADGTRAFTANISAGSITEFDLVQRAVVRQVPVGAPMTEGIAVTPDGREVWVGSNQAGTVSVVDVRAGKVVSRISGFRVPYRLAISPDARTALVADPEANAVHVVDVPTRRIVAAIDSLRAPRGVTISPDGRTAFVTVAGENAVAVIDVASRKVLARFPVGTAPDGVGYAPAGR